MVAVEIPLVLLALAVRVTEPDHMHAFEAVKLLRQDKKVFVPSPAARTIEESRILFAEAQKRPGCLAVGDVGPVQSSDRQTEERIREFGRVTSVTVSSGTKMPYLGTSRPPAARSWTDACPNSAAWMRWIGVMPLRPYYPLYVENEGWRAFLDFGTGPLGLDGARLMRPVFRVLALGVPEYAERISVRGASPDRETYPQAAEVRFVFRGGFELVWRHGPDVETSLVWRNDCGDEVTTRPSASVSVAEQLAALDHGDLLPVEAVALTETVLLGCRAMMTDRRVTIADCEKRYMREGWEW